MPTHTHAYLSTQPPAHTCTVTHAHTYTRLPIHSTTRPHLHSHTHTHTHTHHAYLNHPLTHAVTYTHTHTYTHLFQPTIHHMYTHHVVAETLCTRAETAIAARIQQNARLDGNQTIDTTVIYSKLHYSTVYYSILFLSKTQGSSVVPRFKTNSLCAKKFMPHTTSTAIRPLKNNFL